MREIATQLVLGGDGAAGVRLSMETLMLLFMPFAPDDITLRLGLGDVAASARQQLVRHQRIFKMRHACTSVCRRSKAAAMRTLFRMELKGLELKGLELKRLISVCLRPCEGGERRHRGPGRAAARCGGGRGRRSRRARRGSALACLHRPEPVRHSASVQVVSRQGRQQGGWAWGPGTSINPKPWNISLGSGPSCGEVGWQQRQHQRRRRSSSGSGGNSSSSGCAAGVDNLFMLQHICSRGRVLWALVETALERAA